MSWTLPPNGDVGRIDIDWLTQRLEKQQAINNLLKFLFKIDPTRFGKKMFVEDEILQAHRYFSRP